MTSISSSDQENTSTREIYQTLVRSLRRRKGFGIVFIQCSPAQANRLIPKLQVDLSKKEISVIQLSESIENLYNIVEKHQRINNLNVLVIRGLEKSLESDIKPGYGGQGEYYNLDTVPRILSHLNQQRENFRDHFPNICFVFILPLFAVKYFIRRAPDFFDWGSGVYAFPTDVELLEEETSQLLRSESKDFYSLSKKELNQKILQLQQLIEEPFQTTEQKASLLFNLGIIYTVIEEYSTALKIFDQVIELQPEQNEAWYNRASLLSKVERYEEAYESYEKVLKNQEDDFNIWRNQGNALLALGRYEEAIIKYDKAIALQVNDYQSWTKRGDALGELGKYKEAVDSYDKVLDIATGFKQESYRSLAFSHRASALEQSGYTRYQAINLETNTDCHLVILAIIIYPARQKELDVNFTVRVQPDSYQSFLPENLQLNFLTADGTSIMEITSRSKDSYINAEFMGSVGECFNINLTLGESSITEKFLISSSEWISSQNQSS